MLFVNKKKEIKKSKSPKIGSKIYTNQRTKVKYKARYKRNFKNKRNNPSLFFRIKRLFSPRFFYYSIKRNTFFLYLSAWQKFVFGYLILALISLSFMYLVLWDKYFLVKNFNIYLANGPENNSYLSKTDIVEIVETWQSSKIYYIFPQNQYWFIHEENLSLAAKNVNPNINSVRITDRHWPNTVDIEIETKPILLTLSIKVKNQVYYLRVNKDGSVSNLDQSGINQNLVGVRLPLIHLESGDLEKLDFSQNKDIYNRLWFTSRLLDWLSNYMILKNSVLGIEYPSLMDTDVILILKNGLRLIFDSQSTSWENQTRRIRFFFENQKWSKEYLNGSIKYVDMRVSKKFFICYNNRGC